MAVAYRDELYDYYEVVFPLPDPRFKYLFLLYADGGRVYKLDGSGLRAGENTFDDISECFAFAYAYPPDPMPDWARGCVGYQIFPDRFRRAGGTEAGLEPWDSCRVQKRMPFRRQHQRHPRGHSLSERAGRHHGVYHAPFP